MIAPIFQHPNPSPALQDAMRETMIHLNIKDGLSDSKGIPFPLAGGVVYQNNVMEGVALAADMGGCAWNDKREGKSTEPDPNQSSLFEVTEETPIESEARKVADLLGYDSVSNCAAMWRDAIAHGLCEGSMQGGVGWIMATPYGLEQLAVWERDRDE